jgi:hypothetical protein
MNRKAFLRTRDQLATTGMPCAVGSAQVAAVYLLPDLSKEHQAIRERFNGPGGRNLDANDAHRIVAQVSLGKHSMLFRLGNDPKERAPAIGELTFILQRARRKVGGRLVPFPQNVCECVATVALDELTIDMCPTCSGAGVVRDHSLEDLSGPQPMRQCPSCAGSLRRRYTDDERIMALAKAWIAAFSAKPLDDPGAPSIVANSLRKHPHLQKLLYAIEYAKHELLAAERVAVEETARMVGRW